jgi:hypothetical protein
MHDDRFGLELAFAPTFRKSYHDPSSENAITYTLSGLKFALSIIALTTFSVTTVLYPASLVFTNGAFVVLLLVRRRSTGVGAGGSESEASE